MEYEELKGDVFTFTEENNVIEGKLIDIEDGKTYGNKVYKIETLEGLKVVFSTTILESLMSGVKINENIKIAYDGEKENKKAGQKPIKQFRVFKEK